MFFCSQYFYPEDKPIYLVQKLDFAKLGDKDGKDTFIALEDAELRDQTKVWNKIDFRLLVTSDIFYFIQFQCDKNTCLPSKNGADWMSRSGYVSGKFQQINVFKC